MKIHFIQHLPGYAWGGSEVLWAALALRMLEGGHSVSVEIGSLSKVVDSVNQLHRAGARIYLRSRLADRPAVARKLTPLRARRMRRSGVDIIFVNLALHGLGLDLLEAVHRSGRPYVILIQSVNAASWPADRLADRLRSIYSGASALLFVSEGNQKAVQDMLAKDFSNGRVVCNVPHAPRLRTIPWPMEGELNELSFAVVGRVEPVAKGHDFLLEILQEDRWRVRGVHVNIYGTGASFETFKRAVKRADLENQVTLHGHISDMDKIWSDNHVLLLPSRYEGSPLVLVEAMLSGRPLVATAIPGCAEWIVEGENGFLAESASAPALDRAMEACWENRAELESMGQYAREFALQRLPTDPLNDLIKRLEENL